MEFTLNIRANVDRFSSGFAQMRKDTELFKRSMNGVSSVISGLRGGLAAVGLTVFNNSVDKLIEKADAVKDRAEALNVSKSLVQQIGNVVDIDRATTAMEKLAEAQQKITSGDDKDFKLTKHFAELGVTLEDIKSKNFEQLFLQIADSMNRTASSGAKITAMRAILGRGSGAPLIEGFQKGLNSSQANAGIMSDETIDELSRMKDERKVAGGFLSDMMLGPKSLWAKVITGLSVLPRIPGAIIDDATGQKDAEISQEVRAKRMQEKLSPRDAERARKQIEQAQADAKSAKDKEKLAKVQERADAMRLQNREKLNDLLRSEMTAEQRINAIKKERLELQKQINSESDPLKKQKLLSRDLELRGDLSQLRKASENGSRMIEGDSMAKRGLFIGSTPSPIRQIEHQTIILKKVEKHLADLNKKADE